MAEGQAAWPDAPIERTSNGLRLTRTIGLVSLTIGIKDIRTASTGTHATVMLFSGTELLDYSNFGVLRSEDRVRLANRAHERLGPLAGAAYPKWLLQRDLDLVCLRADTWSSDLFTAEELAGAQTKIEFFLEPYLAKGSGTIMFAKPGSTKSYLALLFAVAVDSGMGGGIWAAWKHKTLFINLERSRESIANRLHRVNRVMGLPPERRLLTMNLRGKSLITIAISAARVIERWGVECVILDSISRAGGDLNENKDANAVMDILNGFGGAWLAVGHPPRGDASHTFGSQMFDAAADLTVQVLSERHGQSTGVGLKMVKFNDIKPRDTQYLRLDFDDDGLVNLVKPGLGEFRELTVAAGDGLAEQIAELLPVERGMEVRDIVALLKREGIAAETAAVRTALNRHAGTMFNLKSAGRGKPGWWSLKV